MYSFLKKSGLVGLVGFVSVLNGMKIRINEISGISPLFELNYFAANNGVHAKHCALAIV